MEPPSSGPLFGPDSGVMIRSAEVITASSKEGGTNAMRKDGQATSMEGGHDTVSSIPKAEILDDSQRPRFEDSRGERVFCYSVGMLISVIGIIMAALIAGGIIGIGDGTQRHHIIARWTAFPIVLGFSLFLSIVCWVMMLREFRAMRQELEDEHMETEMQETVITTKQDYKRLVDDETASNDVL